MHLLQIILLNFHLFKSHKHKRNKMTTITNNNIYYVHIVNEKKKKRE